MSNAGSVRGRTPGLGLSGFNGNSSPKAQQGPRPVSTMIVLQGLCVGGEGAGRGLPAKSLSLSPGPGAHKPRGSSALGSCSDWVGSWGLCWCRAHPGAQRWGGAGNRVLSHPIKSLLMACSLPICPSFALGITKGLEDTVQPHGCNSLSKATPGPWHVLLLFLSALPSPILSYPLPPPGEPS